MSPSIESIDVVAAATEEQLTAQVDTLNEKPRRPREEYPEFEDPAAELEKQPTDLVKPERNELNDKIGKIQTQIDGKKRAVEKLNQQMDAIKARNAERKSQGGGEMEAARNTIRELKSKIVGHIEEKRKITGEIEQAKQTRRAVEDQLQSARKTVGRFTSNDAIDEEIARVQHMMHHQNWTIAEEKQFMSDLKQLEASRESVKILEQLEIKNKNTKFTGMPALHEARNAKNEIIDELKEQEQVAVDKLNALKEKRDAEINSNNFKELADERSTIRDSITEQINEIKAIREEFKKEEDVFYKTDRLIRELKRQISNKNRAARDADRAARAKDRAEADGEVVEEDDEEEVDEDGEKLIDYDLAMQIQKCEQLMTFLGQYKAKETKAVEKEVKVADGGLLKGINDKAKAGLEDDPLGLNAFMVDEAVSSKKKKKDKKKAKNNAKASKVPDEGEVLPLNLSLEVMHQFSELSLPTPVNTDDVDGSLVQLKEKKEYFEAEGKKGVTLKALLKREKDSRKQAKKLAEDKANEDKAAKEAVEAAKAAAEEEALNKMKAAEEAENAKKQEAAEKKAREAEEALNKMKAAEEAENAKKQEAAEKKAREAEEAMLAAEAKAKAKADAEKAREQKRLQEQQAEAELEQAEAEKKVAKEKRYAEVAAQVAKAREEAARKKAEAEAPAPGRDFAAEKLARKAAEMPDVDPDIDLAALRAKAQGAKMSDEEKKARGLLYDKSIASAVRDESEDEEDDGGADFAMGDPFAGLDDDEEEEDAAAEHLLSEHLLSEKPKVSQSSSPTKDAFDEGFEAYLKAQGLDDDDDDEEDEETEIVFGKAPTKGFPASVNLHLQKSDGSVKVVITI